MSNMFLNVVSTFKGDGLSAATRQLGAFGSQAGGLGSTLTKVGAALASFGIAAKAIEFTKTSIDSARDLERNLFSVNTIFDNLAPRMIQFTKDAENIGLSQKDAAKAVTFLGSVLKQSGFAMDDVATESEKLVSLGVDLAATYGYDVQEALLGMTALFRGEYDPIEKFGVAMKQSEINAILAERGLNKLTGAAFRNAEQTVRMELLYQRAADATGAFTAQSGNLFVEQKKLTAQFENMQAKIGNDLLPVMGGLVAALVPLVDELTPRLAQAVEDATPSLTGLVSAMQDASDKSTTTGQAIGMLADALGYAFRLLSQNLGLLIQLSALFLAARTAVVLFTIALKATPFGAAVTGITLVAGSTLVAIDNFKKLRAELNRTGDAMTDAEKDSVAFTLTLTNFNPFNNPVIKLLQDRVKLLIDLSQVLENLPKNVVVNVKLEMETRNRELAAYLAFLGGRGAEAAKDDEATIKTEGGETTQKADTGLSAFITNAKKEAKIFGKEFQLLAAGLSVDVVQALLATTTPIQTANEALARISKNGQQAIDNITRAYNESAAGQQATAELLAELTAQSAAGLEAWTTNAKNEAAIAALEIELIGAGLSAAVAASLVATTEALQTGQEALNAIAAGGAAAIQSMTDNFNASAAGRQEAATALAAIDMAAKQAAAELAERQREAARAAEEAARAEAAALAERERVFKSFQDSVKNTFAGIRDAILGAFDITALGGSTNAILRNMDKMLVRLRTFSANVKQLATMGLNPELLQQVISMGPMAGARLASALVQGGTGALGSINAGFGEFGSLASDIARTGTDRMFDTEAQRNVYNINVGGGVGSGATIGKAIVDAIKAYERTSGAVWQGA